MYTTAQTFEAVKNAEQTAQVLCEQLNKVLTWGDLDANQRDTITRASNAAELAHNRIQGHHVDVLPVADLL